MKILLSIITSLLFSAFSCLGGTYSYPLPVGYSLIGSHFLPNDTLGTWIIPAAEGDVAVPWNFTSQQFGQADTYLGGSWLDASFTPVDPAFPLGSGLLYQNSGSARTWTRTFTFGAPNIVPVTLTPGAYYLLAGEERNVSTAAQTYGDFVGLTPSAIPPSTARTFLLRFDPVPQQFEVFRYDFALGGWSPSIPAVAWGEAVFLGEFPPGDPAPNLQSVQQVGPGSCASTTIRLTFDRTIDPVSATLPSSYSLIGATVNSVTPEYMGISIGFQSVLLDITITSPCGVVLVTAPGVTSLGGTPSTGTQTFTSGLLSCPCSGPAPINDEPASATALTAPANVVGSLTCANPSPLGPIPPRVVRPFPTGTGLAKDVWYKFMSPVSAPVTVTTCGPAACATDTVLAVYWGTDEALINIAGSWNNDNQTTPVCSINPLASRVVFNAQACSTYYIRVSGQNSVVPGDFTLNLTQLTPAAPPNDACASPKIVTANSSTIFDNRSATTGATPPPPPFNDLWFRFVAPPGAVDATVETCTTFNCALDVYTGNNCASLVPVPFTTVAAGCPSGSTGAKVTFPVTPGVSYRVRVGGVTSADLGCGFLHVSSGLPPANTLPSGTPNQCKTYTIFGRPNGTPWSWSLTAPGGCNFNIQGGPVVVPIGLDAIDVATAFASSINGVAGGQIVATACIALPCGAISPARPELAYLRICTPCAPNRVVLKVGLPDCWVENQALLGTIVPCVFNPSIYEIADPDATLDDPQTDCNGNGQSDYVDIVTGTSLDANGDGIPDECQICPAITNQPPAQLMLSACSESSLSVGVSGSAPLAFQWQRFDSAGSVFADIAGATSSVLMFFTSFADDGAQFRVVATNSCGSVTSAVTTLHVQADTTPPVLLSAVTDCASNQVTLTFNERLDAVSATNSSNYPISGGVTVQSAVLGADARTVQLTTTPQTPGVAYTLTVHSVQDLCGNAVAPNTQAAFSCAPPGNPESCSSKGTNFWLAFPQNWNGDTDPSVLIAGCAGTSGEVSIPGLGFSQTFTIPALGGMATVVLNTPGVQITTSGVTEDKGVQVTASAPVSVYGFNQRVISTDGYLALPEDRLGTEYIVLAYAGPNQLSSPDRLSEFAIVASQNGTTVTITPSVATISGQAASVPFTVSLGIGQTYQLRGNPGLDLTGTKVTATQPIGVFGAHEAARVPHSPLTISADHLVEQLPPVPTWGKQFFTTPLATRANGDTVRILASVNGTTVTINGGTPVTLNCGGFHDQILTVPACITADFPVLVAQYAHGQGWDTNENADPFMMLVPATSQFVKTYCLTTPTAGFDNWLNIIVPTADVSSLRLDGSPISAAFTPIWASGFSGASVQITPGFHRVTTTTGLTPFGVKVYGWGSFESYGYPADLCLEPCLLPTIICPDDITLSIAGSGVVVNYPAPTVTGGALADCVPPSGSTFSLGTTLVTCTATNACGTNTCTFNVTVRQVICPTNVPNLVVNGSFEAPLVANNTFTWIQSLLGWMTTSSQGEFELWAGPLTSVPALAGSGNQHLEINAHGGDETVSQDVPVTTNCPTTLCFFYTGRFPNPLNNRLDVEVSWPGAGSPILVTLNPVWSYSVGGWQLSVTAFTPTASPLTIKFHGMPADGNEGGAHIDNVVLMQDPLPTIICPADITLSIAGNSVVVNYPAPIVTGAGSALVDCMPPSGSTFFPGTTPVTCTATNACGSTNCTFNVTVLRVISPKNGTNWVWNGSFEEPPVGTDLHNQNLDGQTGVPCWTATTPSGTATIELWNGSFGGILPQHLEQHLEINANHGDETVSQAIGNLDTNCPATLCFYYTGRFPNRFNNTFELTILGSTGPTVTFDPVSYTVGGWQFYTVTFIPSAPTVTLQFHGIPADGIPGGAHIDDVVLTQEPPPKITCPADITLNIAGSGVVVNYPAPTVTAGTFAGCTPASGSTFALGTTLVTCMATNSCGTNTCTFNVTVLQVLCPTNGSNRVVNGSFETPSVANNTFTWIQPVPGWMTTDSLGDFELWAGTANSIPSQAGNQHLEINAHDGDETVSQDVPVTTNCPATLCFFYTGRFPNPLNNALEVEVSWPGAGSPILANLTPVWSYSVGGWQLSVTTFTPTASPVTIQFHGMPADGNEGGAHIDDVVLIQDCPQPCTPNTTLLITLSGNNMVISWSGAGYRLQATTLLANPSSATVWSNIPGTSPVTLPASDPQKFFRLVCP